MKSTSPAEARRAFWKRPIRISAGWTSGAPWPVFRTADVRPILFQYGARRREQQVYKGIDLRDYEGMDGRKQLVEIIALHLIT